MISKITSGAITGVDGYTVTVEVDISNGLPSFEIVGLPDSSIKEAKERIRSAIKNAGFSFPQGRITVNLAPAFMRKEGSGFDLPIACAILGSISALPKAAEDYFIAGELSLDGIIRPVNGILPMALHATQNGVARAIVPRENAEEAALVKGLQVYPVNNLSELIGHFRGNTLESIQINVDELYNQGSLLPDIDFSDVKGQENIKRALEVAASGMHNVLLIGPPGSGKTMMAKRLTTVLPNLSFEESLEVTKIYSVSGLLRDKNSLVTSLPFRSPHHTISYAALTGGGKFPKPGEISLAHRGVLFLDELPEFQKNALEALRQPMEERQINIARASGNVTYPASFMLVASMNPCPCGHYGDGDKCRCSPREIKKYLARISGPLLDRIDIQVEAKKVNYEDLGLPQNCERSADVKERIKRTISIQKERYRNEKINSNSELTAALIDKYCPLTDQSRKLLEQAFTNMGLSARAYHKIIMLARTLADMAQSEEISLIHVAEAIQFRSLDRKYW